MTDQPDLTLKGKVRNRPGKTGSKTLSRSECREIGERVASSESITDIAKDLGVSRECIYQHLKYDDLTKQSLIRIQENHLRQTLPLALEIQHETLLDDTDKNLRYTAVKDVLGQASMNPSQHQSIYVQQTFNQANLYMTPYVRKLIEDRNKAIDNFVDVEVLEKENGGGKNG